MYRSIIYNSQYGNGENIEDIYNKYSFIQSIRNFVNKINEKITERNRNITYNVKYKLYVRDIDWLFLVKDKIVINDKNKNQCLQDIKCKQIKYIKKDGNYINIKDSCLNIRFSTIDFIHEVTVSCDNNINKYLDSEDIEKLYISSLEDYRALIILSKHELARFKGDAIRPYAEKNAKVAIMARNTSHNLGSHVMSYLKHSLSSVNDMIKDSVLGYIFSELDDIEMLFENPEEWKNKQKIKKIDDVTLPFLVGLGKFISYIQERQDFIACTAVDYSPTCSILNFKDFIYDELNPDKRYKRHPDRKGLKPANILLGNIAKSEGFSREIFDSTKKQDDNNSNETQE